MISLTVISSIILLTNAIQGYASIITSSLFILLPINGIIASYLFLNSDTQNKQRQAHTISNLQQCLIGQQRTIQMLRARIAELEDLARESMLSEELSDLLQASRTIEEVCGVVELVIPQSFPGYSGALYIYDEQDQQAEKKVSWGRYPPHQCVLDVNMALLQTHHEPQQIKRRLSQHYQQQLNTTAGHHICVPMLSQNELVGVLYLHCDKEQVDNTQKQLAITLAEYIGLAISNLSLREKLRDQAIRDPLTNVFNRRYMEETLELELARARRSGNTLGIMMIDLDHFKKINDTLGHSTGDAVLRALGDFLRRHVRSGDIVCRYGGEEFVMIIPSITLTTLLNRAEEIRQGVKTIDMVQRNLGISGLSLSIGIAVFPTHGTHRHMLLSSADAALYNAKDIGRDCVVTAEEITTTHTKVE